MDTKTRTCAVSHMTFFQELNIYGGTSAGNDIPWIRSLTKLPLVIKGIQCLEVSARFLIICNAMLLFQDAERALEVYKVDGIVLSNHGGRQLD